MEFDFRGSRQAERDDHASFHDADFIGEHVERWRHRVLPPSKTCQDARDGHAVPLVRSLRWGSPLPVVFVVWHRTSQTRILIRMSNTGTIPSSGYRYITSVPGVCGGQAIVEGTRIGVHDVRGLLQSGETVESVVANCLPTLTRAQVYECLAYYEDHRGEIDLLVARQMQTEA